MGATSVYKVRRKAFRWFYWGHQGYVVFLVGACLHEWTAWYYVVGPMLYFVYDRLAGRINVRLNTTAAVTKASDDVVKVTIRLSNGYAGSKGYAPGDYIIVAFPSISAINWHPFSIASYYPTTPDRITFYVRTGGGWTQKLLTLCDDRVGEPKRVPVKVDGIFGARSTAYLSYDTLVLVGAGTGIAALIPFLKHYAAMHSSGRLTPNGPSIYLIWVAKKKADVLVYNEFLADLADSESKLGCHVDVHLYLTREQHQSSPSATLTGVQHGTVEKAKLAEGNAASGNVCDIRIIAETNSGSRAPSVSSTTSKSQSGLCSTFSVLLILAVFGIGIAVYCLNRILMFSYTKTMCQARTAYTLQGWDHFICWYWYRTPAILPVIVALLFGLIVVAVHDRLQAKSKLADRWRAEDDTPKQHLHADETTLSQIGFACGRPDFGRFFDVLERQQAIRDGGVIGILAAGPDRLVRAVENEVVGKRPMMHFYRESWKI
ncbi:hypothetical protein HK102_009883 [Quaeritorhiza haematococci]|nr:hypothetical protein HK102_009883 [Quaeritorhiza haematococci]